MKTTKELKLIIKAMKTTKELKFIHNAITGSFYMADENACKSVEYPKSVIIVPAGVPVTHKTACGYDENYHFVASHCWADRYYHHDIIYHGINIPKEFVEQLKTNNNENN